MRKPSTAKKADSAAAKRKSARKPKAKTKAASKKVVLATAEGIEPETVTGDPPKHPGGRPTKYKPEYARIARTMCNMGATDAELADAFEVKVSTIWRWTSSHPEFCSALKVDKGEYDERIKRSLAQRALGYSYDAVKIFHPAGAPAPVYAPYREHVPPDPGAAKIWLCNRQPEEWRDRKELTGADGTPLVPVLNVSYG